MEPYWKNKSLENLENDFWNEIDYPTSLVERIHKLRKIPLSEFTIEDLRIVIGQNFSLDHLVPLAIGKLRTDLLAEGDLYAGDLLQAVLNINADFWKKNPDLKKEVNLLLEGHEADLKENDIDVEAFYSI